MQSWVPAALPSRLPGALTPIPGSPAAIPHPCLPHARPRSFREPVRYRLGDRGLVVVTGQVQGSAEAGLESNGAGKTALMMAPLWALTGGVDARAEVRGVVWCVPPGWIPPALCTAGISHAPFPRSQRVQRARERQVSPPPSQTRSAPTLPHPQGSAATGGRAVLADVVNEDSRRARVRVEGSANGAPFVVERTASRK